MNISTLANAKLRCLPCGHAAHDTCIRSGLDAARNTEAMPYSAFRCKHEGCRALVFPSLNRARKKKKKSETQSSAAGAGAASVSGGSVSSSATAAIGAGFDGLSVSGVGTRFGLGPVLDPQSGNFGVAHPRGFGGLVATARGSVLIPAATPPLSRVLAPAASASSILTAANSRIGSPAVAAMSDDLPDLVVGADTNRSQSSMWGDLSGQGLGMVLGSRSLGRSSSGQVLKGKTRALYDARKPEPSKPLSHTLEEVNNPANPMRGRQLFHRSPLAPLGTMKGQPRRDFSASLGFEQSASRAAGGESSFTASALQGNGGSLLVRSASSARLVTTPIVHPDTAGGAGASGGTGTGTGMSFGFAEVSSGLDRSSDGQRTTSASASASATANRRNASLRMNSADNANATEPIDTLSISGGSISSHMPSGMPGLVQVLRATSGAAAAGAKRGGQGQMQMQMQAQGGDWGTGSQMISASVGITGPARKGKLAKSSLGRPPPAPVDVGAWPEAHSSSSDDFRAAGVNSSGNTSGSVFAYPTMHAEGYHGNAQGSGQGIGLGSSLSSTQLTFRSRAKLSEHLQPSGMSRTHARHAVEPLHHTADTMRM
jgi:hypothetical protein